MASRAEIRTPPIRVQPPRSRCRSAIFSLFVLWFSLSARTRFCFSTLQLVEFKGGSMFELGSSFQEVAT